MHWGESSKGQKRIELRHESQGCIVMHIMCLEDTYSLSLACTRCPFPRELYLYILATLTCLNA